MNFGDVGFDDELDLIGSLFLLTAALRAANGELFSLLDEGGVNGNGAMLKLLIFLL